MIRGALDALDDRLGTSHFASRALRKAFPDHWSFMLGEIAVYAFLALLATGTYLAFFYAPSTERVVYHGVYAPLAGRPMSAAYRSVLDLSFATDGGLLIRQVHHWSANLFTAAIIAHMCRVFFTGAFRKPRELNWTIGLTLMVLAFAEGFTGYSLPDDVLSGTGLRIAYSIAIGIPIVGPWLGYASLGGPFPSPEMVHRLYALHIYLLPLSLAGLIGLHLAVLWRQKHTQFPGPGKLESSVVGSPLWPNYAFKSIGLLFASFAVLFALGAFFQINPIWQYGPYEPSIVAEPAQPDWYVGWMDGALRIWPPTPAVIFGHVVPSSFFPAMGIPGALFGLLYAWPLLERVVTRDEATHHLLDHPVDKPHRTAFGVALIAFAVTLGAAGSNDIQAAFFHIDLVWLIYAYRIGVFALPVFAYVATYRIAAELRDLRSSPGRDPAAGELRRSAAGGFEPSEASR